MSHRRFLSALVAACALATAGSASAASPASPPTSQDGYREIKWDDLIPPGWDPYKRFRDPRIAIMDDGDPQMQDLMADMRKAWDNAPTVSQLDGVAVKVPGYIVPLDEAGGKLKEFLLVPYFGACIHSPPPPANQIIHVVARTPLKGFRAMDTVWISGALGEARKDSYMGASGYEMQADLVTRYVARPQ